ncbi:lipase esterase [Trichoderma arundinaceum]|uniref:Lipase esterase n=1 Tax=Trichoderma arundinaceum TaxID=490622 RepID=A0A395N9R2_TRIAR|nr:lipase esterase [Trichoderma arundinaceum]
MSFAGDLAELARRSKDRQTKPSPSAFRSRKVSVPGYNGYQNQVRVHGPDIPSTNGAPRSFLVFSVHGGEWTFGDLDTEGAVCKAICKGNNVTVVSVDYRKFEIKSPQLLQEANRGTQGSRQPIPHWPGGCLGRCPLGESVFDNLDSLGGSPDHVTLGDLSAGANFTAALMHRAKEAKRVLRGQILRIPMVVHPAAQPVGLDFSSYQENANALILSAETVMQFLNGTARCPQTPACPRS